MKLRKPAKRYPNWESFFKAHLRHYKRTGGDQASAKCPIHDDRRPSLSLNIKDGLWYCHGPCKIGGNGRMLARYLGISESLLPIENVYYDYLDESDTLLYQTVRTPDKEFWARRPDGNGGWINSVKGVRRVLYRLPAVIAAVRDKKSIIIVEGEKDVDTLFVYGFVATCNPFGAGKWSGEYSEFLRGAYVFIVADKDEAGRKHAKDIAQSLIGIAKSIKVVEMPGEGVKDATDWFNS